MKQKLMKKIIIYLLTAVFLISSAVVAPYEPTSIQVEAHSGRTDSSGGHKDNKNKSGLGSYHYHCGGNPAHLHTDGCPYSENASAAESADTTINSNTSKTSTDSSAKVSKETIKSVQAALNGLGYTCGKADGIIGKKTKKAIEAYQTDNELTVDGKVSEELIKSLELE